jgi:opacity protein-like surface antigen
MRRFHCAALAAVAVIGFASIASAADMAVKSPVYSAQAAYNWTGFYVGVNAGVSAGVAPLTQTTAIPPFPASINNQSTHDAFGAIGGLQAGYNWQVGRLVWGVEGDFQFSGQKSDPTCLTFCDFNFLAPTQVQFDSVAQSIPWFATLRGRFGYTAGPALFYITAGAAYADIKTTYNTTEVATFNGTVSDRRVGLAVGTGVESALSGNWTAKVEYLYLNFGTINARFPYSAPGGGFGPPGPSPVGGEWQCLRSYSARRAELPLRRSSANRRSAAYLNGRLRLVRFLCRRKFGLWCWSRSHHGKHIRCFRQQQRGIQPRSSWGYRGHPDRLQFYADQLGGFGHRG